MQDIEQLRSAVDEYIAIGKHSSNSQLSITIEAYADQVTRLLDLAESALRCQQEDDAERHVIDAQRWLWKIAKSCTLYALVAG